MPVTLMGPATGLTKSKLALATAMEGDVLSGKTFYGGNDKEIRTGVMINHEAYTEPISHGYSDSILYVRIPQGAYLTNASSGCPEIKFIAGNALASSVLSEATFTSGNVGVNVVGTMPNQNGWSTSINRGESVTIPAGYHNGNGKVTANSIHVITRSGSWKITKNYNGSATLSTTTSIDYSDLKLTAVPQITVGLAIAAPQHE